VRFPIAVPIAVTPVGMVPGGTPLVVDLPVKLVTCIRVASTAPGAALAVVTSLSYLLRVCHPEAGDHDGGTKEDVVVPFLSSGEG